MMDISQTIWKCLLWCLAYHWKFRLGSADEYAEAAREEAILPNAGVCIFLVDAMCSLPFQAFASSPLEMPQHAIPSYLMNIYEDVSNQSNNHRYKSNLPKTYVSFVNSAHSSSSTCYPGNIIFNLSKEARNDVMWHSAKVYFELMSAFTGRLETKPRLRATLNVNQINLGNTEIETGRYSFIDISEESYSWWQKREYMTPEMAVNFYSLQEDKTESHCKGIFWRASLLLTWTQSRRIAKWNDKMVASVGLPSLLSNDKPHPQILQQKKRLKRTIEKSRNRRLVSERPKRSLQIPSPKDVAMESQKDLFLEVITERGSDEWQIENLSFQNWILDYLLEEQKKFFRNKELNSELFNPLLGKRNAMPFQKRRSSRQVKQKTTKFKTRCSMERGIFNFAQLGLHSILAPKEYETGKCFGKCRFPLDFHSQPTGFTILASMQRFSTGKGRFSCCVPTEMDPLTIFLNDGNGRYIIQHVDDMIVRSCGCR